MQLKGYCDIDIIIDSDYTPQNLKLVEFFNILPFNQFTPVKYDEIIYQFGNNLYHKYMIPFLYDNPGITVLHDINQHGIFYHMAITEKTSIYLEEMKYNYGEAGEMEAKEVLAGRRAPDIFGKPLLKRIVHKSKGIITHSEFAKNQLLRDFPGAPIYYLPMATSLDHESKSYNLTEVANRFSIQNKVVISVPGFVTSNKRIYELILSYEKALPAFNENTVLLIVGTNDIDKSYTVKIKSLIGMLGLSNHVRLIGEVAEEDFNSLILLSDIVVNLRRPYVGETSSTVIRAIEAGKPLIVTKVGFFNELPDSLCIKVRNNKSEIQDIKEALIKLVNNESLRFQMGKNAVLHSSSLQKLASEYYDVIISSAPKLK